MQLRFTPVHVLLASTLGPCVAVVVFGSALPAGAQMVVAGPRAGMVGPTTIRVPGVGSGISIHAPLLTVHIPPPGSALWPYALPRRRFLSRWRQNDPTLLPGHPRARVWPHGTTRHQATGKPPTPAPQIGQTGRAGETGSAIPNGNPTLATSKMVAPPERSIGNNLPNVSNTVPSDEMLAAMDDVEFLNALAAVWLRLDSRLTRLSTGAGWQRYLSMPAGVLLSVGNGGAARLSVPDIQKTLDRYDRVAANPKYSVIAKLPSFAAMQRVLRQMAHRFQDVSIGDLEAESDTPNMSPEILPEPEVATESQHHPPTGERSVLKR